MVCEPPGTTFWHMRLVCETDASNSLPGYEFDFHACVSRAFTFEKYLKYETRTLVRTFGWEEENLKERRENVSIGRRRNWIGFHRISSLSPAAARDIPQRHAWRTNTALRLREIVTWRVYHRQAVHGRRR